MIAWTPRSHWYLLLTAFVFTSFFSAAASAVDGKLEINQSCVAAGCFPGDSPGFPVDITNPGSYVLTGDIDQSTPNGSGVRIQVDNVTLDLNGFSITGSGTVAGTGIELQGNHAEVMDGRILNFGAALSKSTNDFGNHSRAVALTILSVSSFGVRLGEHSYVENCQITSDGPGIVVFDHSHVIGNRISVTGDQISQVGIDSNSFSIIRDNIVLNSAGHGIEVSSRSIIDSNLVQGSALSGIYMAGSGSRVTGNLVTLNQNYGLEMFNGQHLVIGNQAYLNNQSAGAFTNIEACATCTLVDNHAP